MYRTSWVSVSHGFRSVFRGGLVFEGHRLLYHSTLGSSVIQKKKEGFGVTLGLGLARPPGGGGGGIPIPGGGGAMGGPALGFESSSLAAHTIFNRAHFYMTQYILIHRL